MCANTALWMGLERLHRSAFLVFVHDRNNETEPTELSMDKSLPKNETDDKEQIL